MKLNMFKNDIDLMNFTLIVFILCIIVSLDDQHRIHDPVMSEGSDCNLGDDEDVLELALQMATEMQPLTEMDDFFNQVNFNINAPTDAGILCYCLQ